MLQNARSPGIYARMKHGGEISLFFTLTSKMQSISETYAVQIERLKKEDEQSQAKTKATLQRIKLLIKTLESIEITD
jgi:hypothetical protein